jgi:DNA anti-recombination protein RmuC
MNLKNAGSKENDEGRTMTDSELSDTLKEMVEQLARLSRAVEELNEVRRHMVNSGLVEEQTVTVVRRLTERWRESVEGIMRLREMIENMTQINTAMHRSFDDLYRMLHASASCPVKEKKGPND